MHALKVSIIFWLMISLLIAAIGFVPFATQPGGLLQAGASLMPFSEQVSYAISFWAGMLWLLVFGTALICVRTKALWLLIGAPFAL